MSLNVKSLENINFRHITQECGEDVARKSGNAINGQLPNSSHIITYLILCDFVSFEYFAPLLFDY